MTADSLFVKALALHQAGRLYEARTLYDQVLKEAPRHGGALHMLGLMAFQAGDARGAVALLGQAARVDPLVPSLHSNLGLALKADGRLDEAVESFRQALALAPGMAEVHNNLGMALLEQGFVSMAAESFARAAGLNPGLAEAHAGLGDALWSLGRLDAAEQSHRKALALTAAPADTLTTLAVLALARGDAAAALERIQQALALDGAAKAQRIFVDIARVVQWEEDDPTARDLITRALEENWGRPAALAGAAAALVKLRLAAGGTLEDDSLLRALLAATPVTDLALEEKLTAARREVLAAAEGMADSGFAVALARQCWLNEYVFAETADEGARIARLAARAAQMTDIPAPLLAALACYRPLGTLAGAEGWTTQGEAAGLLAQQRDEPAEERRLAAALPRLTAIEDDVSRAVQAQYEDNPYPRWTRLAAAPPAPLPLAVTLASRFPFAGLRQDQLPAAPRVLIAGCGTGQDALDFARNHVTGEVLAIDLSRPSLAHAARKAAEAGMHQLRFGQADILAAAQLGERFDIILAGGVLHHLADPFTGWRALLERLKPGGLMGLAFYSEAARRQITAARAFIAREGLAPTSDGIRACRAALKARDDMAAVTASPDFFSLSGCRDLLFHVQESGMTLPALGEFLRAQKLTLVGLETDEAVTAAYRARFPDDPAATNLRNWAAFESERPDTFAAMYHFWVLKEPAR
jgi:Flp pilus assembly protein TadD/2-polyprenyl-3-methyl-5-hydroxy-6-metoxy-1,4-benzoquinol methylase